MKIHSKRHRDAHAIHPYTSHQVQMMMDPVKFINAYMHTPYAIGGTKQIKLHPFQEDFINCIKQNKNVIAVMPRQSGQTMTALAFCLWESMFVVGADDTMILTTDQMNVQPLADILKTMLNSVPAFMRPSVLQQNRTAFSFAKGSRIEVAHINPSTVCGRSPTRVHLDSFAAASDQRQKDAWYTLIGTLVTSNNISMTGTPRGTTSTFAHIWREANLQIANGKTFNDFTPFFKNVHDMTHLDPLWLQSTRKAIGESAWKSEFECQFL